MPKAPDLVGHPDQGLRLVDSRGREATTLQQASSRALENPAIASYRFWALKVPPGTPRSDPGAAAGRGGICGRSGRKYNVPLVYPKFTLTCSVAKFPRGLG
jgi:hypothetical protein